MMEIFDYIGQSGTVYKNCCFVPNHYRNNGNNALYIINDEGPILTCTINALRINAPDEIGIKEWSENKGITKFLIDMGIIHEKPIDTELSGFVHINYYKLTEKGLELYNEQI